MKNIFLFFCLWTTLAAKAQLLMSENFNYTDSLTKNGWMPVSAWGTNGLFAKATGLTHPGFANSGIGNALAMVASGEDSKFDFTAIKKGSVYASFMIRVETIATTVGSYICGFTSGSTGSNYNLRFYVKRDSVSRNLFNFGIGRGTSAATYGTETYALGSQNLITIKYTFDTTGTNNDVVGYYRHPATSTSTNETPLTASNMGTGVGSDATELTAFFLRQGTASDSVTLTIDGIRLATTWGASVSPVLAVNSIEKSAFKVYPTVTKGIVNIDCEKVSNVVDITVVNVQGQVVMAKNRLNTEGVQSLDLSFLTNGTYAIRMVSDKSAATQLIEKQ